MNYMPTRSGKPVDAHVGAQMRLRRTLLGITQERLGQDLGVSFQQIQKYENGHNRISASRLFDICRVLDTPVSFFFDGLQEDSPASSQAVPTVCPTAMALMRHFQNLGPKEREILTSVARVMARPDEE